MIAMMISLIKMRMSRSWSRSCSQCKRFNLHRLKSSPRLVWSLCLSVYRQSSRRGILTGMARWSSTPRPRVSGRPKTGSTQQYQPPLRSYLNTTRLRSRKQAQRRQSMSERLSRHSARKLRVRALWMRKKMPNYRRGTHGHRLTKRERESPLCRVALNNAVTSNVLIPFVILTTIARRLVGYDV